jgi:hypothetical protein
MIRSGRDAGARNLTDGMPPEQAPPVRLGPKLVTAIGLLLAIAGTLAAPEGRPIQGVVTRVFVPLPDWLTVGAVCAVSLASLIFIGMSLRWRRPPKNGEEEFERYDEPQKVSPILGIFLILLALTPGAVLGGALYWLVQPNVSVPPSLAGITVPAHRAVEEQPAEPTSPMTTGLVGTLALLAAIGSLGLVSWLVFADRLRRRAAESARPHRQLAAAVEDSLEDLQREPDARAAIIRIYRNFERVLAAAALPRPPWQTPVEFMRAVLAKSPLPPAPIRSLTGLFELARFSQHPVGIVERESAWRSLTEIRAALDRERQTSDAALP